MTSHFPRLRPDLALAALMLLAAAPAPAAADPFSFFWEQPKPRERAPIPAIGATEIRAILSREGAHLIGHPRRRGDEFIALGTDSAGRTRQFTLDSIGGEVLSVKVIADPRAERRRHEEIKRETGDDLAPPAAPMGPPVHLDGAGSAVVAPPATPLLANPAGQPASGQTGVAKTPDSDAALSPIKPLKPLGAPKVEPLPQ